MDERNITCCFSGHRTRKLPWHTNENDPRCVQLKAEIAARLEGIYAEGYRRFICGMAIGCDFYFAEAVLALREQHPEVTLEAAVPCRTQADKWTKRQQEQYRQLLAECNTVTVLQEEYTPHCMNRRNEYMVDHSSLLLACFNGTPSGTMNTIVYAGRENIPTIILDID